MDQSQGLCSNLLSLAHSNETIMFCKAFTPFVNEPRFGQDGLKTAPRWPKMALRWPRMALRRPEMAQDGPDMALRWPRMAKQLPKVASKWHHETVQCTYMRLQDQRT